VPYIKPEETRFIFNDLNGKEVASLVFPHDVLVRDAATINYILKMLADTLPKLSV
jgi:hypothetical protein